MAHEIDFTTGRAGIAYVGETPWHGLGEKVNPDLPLEEWRIAAGLDWSVLSAMPYFRPTEDEVKPVIDKRVLYRDDTHDVLGVMGDGYEIVQPEEVLEFYRDLIDSHGFKMHTAGSLKGGRKIWALAEVGEGFTIKGQDTVLPFLLLGTSFDGSMATTAQLTAVRVVCQNTLNLSINSKSMNEVKVNHRSKFDEQSVKYQLGLFENGWTVFEKQARALAEREVTPEEAVAFMMSITGVKLEEGQTLEDATKKSRKFKQLVEATQFGRGQQTRSAANTAWGLVNGATFYADHKAPARSQDNRLNSAWFGAGNTMKQKAFNAGLKLLEAA